MKFLFELFFITVGWKFSAAQLKLSIFPSEKNVIVKENEDLNLTCKVSGSGAANYEPSWNLPVKQSNSANRLSIYKRRNELSVTVHKLQERDSGRYVCEVKDGDTVWREKIDVIVSTGKEKCVRPFFDCGDALCIPYHYVCDGYQDCPTGADESFQHCGSDPCEDKFLCDGRCIPKKFCCDRTVDYNCTVNYFMPCCQRLVNSILPVDILKMDGSDATAQYKYHNIGFYQSTVYTMISCAIAFIFMSTIMLIAVCRIRMRNAWYPQSSRPVRRHRFWQLFPTDSSRGHGSVQSRTVVHSTAAPSIHSCTGHVTQSEGLDPLENFVLLTYDSNTGFEVAEYGPKPPPYSESNVGIPPPPYSSMLDVTSDPAGSSERGGGDGQEEQGETCITIVSTAERQLQEPLQRQD